MPYTVYEGTRVVCLRLKRIDVMQGLEPVAEMFLQRYIKVWDREFCYHDVLELLSYLTPCPFEGRSPRSIRAAELTEAELRRLCLSPLEVVMQRPPQTNRSKLLTFLSRLIERWANLIMSTSRSAQVIVASQHFDELVNHAATLMLSLLCSTPNSSSASAEILSHMEHLANMYHSSTTTGADSLPLSVPSVHLIYLFLLGNSASDVSRACGILATYKRVFEKSSSTSHPKPSLNNFNGLLVDVCNNLWRSRALVDAEDRRLASFCTKPVVAALQSYVTSIDHQYSLSSLFDFSHNPVFCALSIVAFRAHESRAERVGEALEAHQAGPVTPQSLATLGLERGLQMTWKHYRVEVLNWLAEKGAGGVREILYATMKDLIRSAG